MPLPEPRPVREYRQVDRARLDGEIRPARQPAVLRGLAEGWPAVAAARRSDEALVAYLKRFAVARPVVALVGEPEIEGRFFYTRDLTALNFARGLSPLQPFLDRLIKDREHPRPLAMAVQSEPVGELLPGFERENGTDLLRADIAPRAWIGNRIRVAPHYDLMENVGIVVAGRRRFTLFPPDQVGNLYAGPLELTPAGTPVSLVDLAAPDLDRFPRFAEAMAHAQTAELAPGDAIYIPFHWWHGVDSLEPVNLFVNYWWNDARPGLGSAYDALMYGFYALKHLPPEQRAIWRQMFDHYVFCPDADPAEHLPASARGVLGEASPELLGRMRETLRRILETL
ncbi:MAG: cupin-like domain-containing protein [Alphaproteobacteria bacterium]|nr:cupin-like domain-containing protein [Alphaproteobacteria bacterium]MBV9370107.1 cupin-like domain-containing protein [Alphaproteobacteria bacterium]MBV9901447.1 cupin-like domain-containing protein [Alphaproteobacteria bacterium]